MQPVRSRRHQQVVCNGDAFQVSEADSAANRERITILRSAFLSSGMAKNTHLPHATETESTGVPAASGSTVAEPENSPPQSVVVVRREGDGQVRPVAHVLRHGVVPAVRGRAACERCWPSDVRTKEKRVR